MNDDFNLVFPVHHCHEQNIYVYHQVLKVIIIIIIIIIIYSLYVSRLALQTLHKSLSFHINAIKRL